MVSMAYIKVTINGMNINAMVACASEGNVMTRACTKACGLWDLLDVRYAGVLRGVGVARRLGRIHCVEAHIGGRPYICDLDVVDTSNCDQLSLGLGFLKKYAARIDFGSNTCILSGVEVPIL